jgi:putative transposase
MPRANRYLLPGYTYHLTHRCHNREFLFRFGRDRTEYQRRLRQAVRQFKISLLAYCITSNHVHLLCRAPEPEVISRFMQWLEGAFAEYYNIRKRRSGAFWEGRYECTKGVSP